MKTKSYLIALMICISGIGFSRCNKEETTPSGCDCQTVQSCRAGANCADGTTSTSTGSGTCSGHGGVQSWICR